MNNSGSDHRFLNDALTLEEAERAERAEWLQWRRGGLGGSDIAGVLGLSPWSSPWSVWADKVINRTDDNETDAMEFGRLAEPLVRTYFERRTGLYVRGEQARMIHPDHPWARITLDGWVADDPDALELRPEEREAADAYDAAAIQAWGGHAYLNQAVA